MWDWPEKAGIRWDVVCKWIAEVAKGKEASLPRQVSRFRAERTGRAGLAR